jgi:hypothetical protein
MTVDPIPLNFLIYEENFLFFFISAGPQKLKNNYLGMRNPLPVARLPCSFRFRTWELSCWKRGFKCYCIFILIENTEKGMELKTYNFAHPGKWQPPLPTHPPDLSAALSVLIESQYIMLYIIPTFE